MAFFTIVLKSLLRRPARSLLTIAGIAIGITAVVALTSIAWGFEKTWVKIYSARGTDLIVTKAGSLSPAPPAFDDREARDVVRSLPRVSDTSGVMSELMGIETAPFVLVFGWESKTFIWEHLRLVTGRWPVDDREAAVVLGSLAAESLDKSVGSSIQIETARFTVCGIFESESLAENGTIVMALSQLQRLTEQPGKVNFLNLKLAPGTTVDQTEALRRTLMSRLPGFKAYTAGDVPQNNTAIQAAKAISWATSTLALLIGSVSVMNTMLMAIFERTREIGILLAIGWRRWRIVRMILYESISLTVVGGLVGMAAGTTVVKMIQITPLMRGKIEGDFSLLLFAVAFLVSIGLGAIGGIYPAILGSRMRPSDAMRHE